MERIQQYERFCAQEKTNHNGSIGDSSPDRAKYKLESLCTELGHQAKSLVILPNSVDL